MEAIVGARCGVEMSRSESAPFAAAMTFVSSGLNVTHEAPTTESRPYAPPDTDAYVNGGGKVGVICATPSWSPWSEMLSFLPLRESVWQATHRACWSLGVSAAPCAAVSPVDGVR